MEQDKTIIQCKRVFRQSPEKVFEMFTSAEHVKAWFGPKEFSIGEVFLEPVKGGRIEIEMITPKGDSLWAKGVYDEIVENERIVYTFAYEPDMPNLGTNQVAFYFTGLNEGTEVQLVQTIFKSINAEGRTKGWDDGFDKMEILLSEK